MKHCSFQTRKPAALDKSNTDFQKQAFFRCFVDSVLDLSNAVAQRGWPVKDWRIVYLVLFVWVFLNPGCHARAQLSGAPAAVIQISSHGMTGTVCATGPGCTIILSAAHGWYRGPKEDERSVPMKFVIPMPAQWQGSGAGTSQLVALDVKHDLALIRLDYGPVPYVCPIPDGAVMRPKRLVAVGYDEMKIPAAIRECHIKEAPRGPSDTWNLTDHAMFHGSSGCSLQADGYLCGVYTGYECSGLPRGLERDPARYKAFVLSHQPGMWVRHGWIKEFVRKNGYGQLLVRVPAFYGESGTPQPNPPAPSTPATPVDPFAGQVFPRQPAPVGRRGPAGCPT